MIYNLNEFLFSFILCHALSSLKRPNRFLCTDVFRQQFAYLDLNINNNMAWKSLERISFWPEPNTPDIRVLFSQLFPSPCPQTTTNIFTLTSFNLICEYFFRLFSHPTLPLPPLKKYWYAPNDGDPPFDTFFRRMVLVCECDQALINFNEAVVVVAVVTVIVVVRVKCRLVLLPADLELAVDSWQLNVVTINTLRCLQIRLANRELEAQALSLSVCRVFGQVSVPRRSCPR